jgi:Domain of unknown function (DUF397)
MTELNRVADLRWRKSAASVSGECVEVASIEQTVLVRDSKDRHGPRLTFSTRAWRNFLIMMHKGTVGPQDKFPEQCTKLILSTCTRANGQA